MMMLKRNGRRRYESRLIEFVICDQWINIMPLPIPSNCFQKNTEFKERVEMNLTTTRCWNSRISKHPLVSNLHMTN